jgi:hypothetical protein
LYFKYGDILSLSLSLSLSLPFFPPFISSQVLAIEPKALHMLDKSTTLVLDFFFLRIKNMLKEVYEKENQGSGIKHKA